MSDAILPDMISQMLGDVPQTSWHEDVRRDLGIPEDCADEALLTLIMHRPGRSCAVRPVAFVIEPYQLNNTLMALSEFLREAFHPVTGRADVLAVIDFLPPLDCFGESTGISRRWVVDKTNYTLLLAQITAYVRIVGA